MMSELMNLQHTPPALFVRPGKEIPRRQARPSGFPEYLKHTDLLRDNTGKMTSANSLFHAVLKGRVRGTQYLLDRGTMVNGRNDYGYSVLIAALHIDVDRRRERMFQLLLRKGADPLYKDSTFGRSVLHWACVLGRAEQAKLLLEEVGGDINLQEKDKASYSALHYAVMTGRLPLVSALVDIHRKYGVTVDMADNLGLTPYLHAKRLGFRDVAEYLHSEGLASQGHSDRQFRTPREWSQIGKFERRKAIESQAKEVINIAKIQGKIGYVRSLQADTMMYPGMAVPNVVLPGYTHAGQPRMKLAVRNTDRLSMSLPSLQDSPPKGHWLRPLSANGASHDIVDAGSDKSPHEDDRAPKPPLEAFVNAAADASNNRHNGFQSSSKDTLAPGAASTSSSPGERSGDGGLNLPLLQHSPAALSLMEMNRKGRHASTYRQSQFDETKASEYQHMLGSLNSIMDMLSQQQSKSFRQSVRYQRPETPPKSKKAKPKVSSLAVIFGRRNGARAKRRKEKGGGGGEEKDKKKAKPSSKKKKSGVVKASNGK